MSGARFTEMAGPRPILEDAGGLRYYVDQYGNAIYERDVDGPVTNGTRTSRRRDGSPTTSDRSEASTTVRRRTSWTATDLLAATFPEPKWAVPGVIPEGLTLLAGAPKLGKSWFVLNAGAAIAAGGRALGHLPVAGGDVLYLALEDPPRRLQERLKLVLNGDPPSDRLVLETEWPTMAEGGAEQLDQRLDALPGCRLVAVDVFAKVRGPVDARASRYDADYMAMTALKELADRHAVPIVVNHHTRKQGAEDFLDQVSGTHGLAAAADAILVMARARSSADAVLKVTGRDVREAEYALRFSPEAGTWTLLDEPPAVLELSDTRRRVLTLLEAQGPMTPKQIAVALTLEDSTARQTVRRMVDDDQLDTDGEGHYFPLSHLSPLSLLSDSSDRSDSRLVYGDAS